MINLIQYEHIFKKVTTQFCHYDRVLSCQLEGYNNNICLRFLFIFLSGLVVIVFAIGPKVRGFKHGRGRGTFKSDTNS
jgi:hypothetical protein